MNTVIKIGFIDDHDLFREGMIGLFKDNPKIKVVFDIDNAQNISDRLRKSIVDVILLDLDMPTVNGDEALKEISTKHPKINVIVLTAFYDLKDLPKYIKFGASAYLPKNYRFEKIVEVIETVITKGIYLDKSVATLNAGDVLLAYHATDTTGAEDTLTDIELKIVRYICQNKSSAQIAELLGEKKRSIEWIRRRIIRKTGCKTIPELVQYAIKKKWVVI